MTWSPTWKATDVRGVLSSLLTYISTHQVEALGWASPSRLLAPLTLYPTAEMLRQKTFPHFGIVRRRIETADTDAGLQIQYTLTAQLEVSATITTSAIAASAELLQLQTDVDNYTLALESMILNWTATGAHYKSVKGSDPLEVAISDTEALFNVQMQIVLMFLE